jgi:hypothetical protein
VLARWPDGGVGVVGCFAGWWAGYCLAVGFMQGPSAEMTGLPPLCVVSGSEPIRGRGGGCRYACDPRANRRVVWTLLSRRAAPLRARAGPPPGLEMTMGKYPPGITTSYPYPRHKNNPTGSPIYIGGYGFTPILIPMWVWVIHRVTRTHKN